MPLSSGAENVVFCPFIRDADMAVRTPWEVPERRLLDYLLVYMEAGNCRFVVEGKDHALSRGDFCLIQPGQRVFLQGTSDTVTPYAHFDLAYNPHREGSFATRPGQMNLTEYARYLQPTLGAWSVNIPTVFRFDSGVAPDMNHAGQRSAQFDGVEQFCRSWLHLVRLWSEGERWERMQADNRLGLFFLELFRHFQTQRPVASDTVLSWIPSYLSTHLAEPISVEMMARRARLSPSRFHRVFFQSFGTTPARYLARMRVRHASELLQTTDWTLAHIAALCGFADVHHFAKAFKHAMQVTPGTYRRTQRP